MKIVQDNKVIKKEKENSRFFFLMQRENSEWSMARKLVKTVNDKVGPFCPKSI